MPLVTVTLAQPRPAEFKAAVLDGVQRALVAAGVPESGMGRTRSASTGDSAASRSPIRTRAPCTSTASRRESGRAR